LIFVYFSKSCRHKSSFIEIWARITGTLHDDLSTIMITSPSILLRIRNT